MVTDITSLSQDEFFLSYLPCTFLLHLWPRLNTQDCMAPRLFDKLIVTQLVMNFTRFQGSLEWRRQPDTGPCPEPTAKITVRFLICFNIVLPSPYRSIKWILPFRFFKPKCMNLSALDMSCVWRVLSVLCSLLVSVS